MNTYRAIETFIELPMYRKLDNIVILLNISDQSASFFFKKEDSLNAISILMFYLDDTQNLEKIEINSLNIDIFPQDKNKTIKKITPFIEKKNILKIFTKNKNHFELLKYQIVYKIEDDKDDDYYFREQLDDLLK
jgi:hypothetical protein